VTAGALSITNGGGITSGTASSGQAGTVKVVVAGDLEVDGRDSPYPTVIASQANYGSTGDAGSVDVTAGGRLSIISGGEISSNTASPGQAGTVKIVAGDLRIDAQGSAYFTGIGSQANRDSTGGTANAGNARSVDVTARGRLSITNDGQIDSSTETSGQAGTVTVTAGELSITSGGRISSSTFSSGPAGTVKVVAGDLEIDRQGSPYFTGIASQANSESTGDAGSVDIIASGRLSITNGGRVSSRTFSSGQAGTVAVTAGELSITIGGRISSSTSASGRGGSVGVNAGTIVADSSSLIDAVAAGGSSGQTGTLTVAASERITLYNGASFSIRNDATVDQPGSLDQSLLTVSAPYITLSNGGQITAASSGNVAASNIAVNFGPQMTVTNAGISTSAKDGNGGRIALSSPIGGAGALVLQDGQVTTSVTGTKGNGGDISVAAPILVMQTGFIQANTAAANARGGDVSIRVGTLLPSGGTLFVGGATPYAFAPGVFGFNVIQAAAPDGVSGTIRISTPVLDITRSLSALPGGYLDTGGLGRSPCAIVGGSSLSQGGRGGLPPAAGDLLWLDPVYEVATVPAPGWQGLIALSPKAPGSARAGALPTIRCRPLQS